MKNIQLTDEQRRREDEIVRGNLPLVGYLVNEALVRLPSHVRREELTSAAMAALALAARSWDPERGVPFNRFASVRIRGAIVDELRSHDWASRSVRAKARRREAVSEELTCRLGRTPEPTELASALGVTADELRNDVDDVHRALVLSLQGGTVEDGTVEDLVPPDMRTPEDEMLDRERHAYLLDAVALLPERLQAVIVGYYLDDRPMAELAAELGVTESRVSQMRSEAIGMLRGGLTAQLEPELVLVDATPDGVVARRRAAYHAAIASHSDYKLRVSMLPTQRTPSEHELDLRLSGLG